MFTPKFQVYHSQSIFNFKIRYNHIYKDIENNLYLVSVKFLNARNIFSLMSMKKIKQAIKKTIWRPLDLLSKEYIHCSTSVALTRLIYTMLMIFLFLPLNYIRFGLFQSKHFKKLGGHFYIIVMRNSLHLLAPCLKLIPRSVNIFLIINDIQKWEEDYLRKTYADFPIFRLNGISGCTFKHGTVLNMFLKKNAYDFGIIDHDCFIFDKNVFKNLKFKKDEFVKYFYLNINKKTNIIFPRTHLMFFNVGLIKKIMKKYRISAKEYRFIPSRLQDKMFQIGIGSSNLPKTYLDYIDTLHLICIMAFYEDLHAEKIKIRNNKIFHVGATTHGRTNALSYVILENSTNHILKEKYRVFYSHAKKYLKEYKLTPEDKLLIKKIASL